MQQENQSSVNQKQSHSFWRKLLIASLLVGFAVFVAFFAYYQIWWMDAIPYSATLGRTTYTEAMAPQLPVLNSITDNPDYSELNFIEVVDPEMEGQNFLATYLEPDREYEVKIYCRNDASEAQVATGVRMAVDLPAKYATHAKSRTFQGSYILCDYIGVTIAYYNGVDSSPQIVSSYTEIFARETLRLEYIPGSAKISSCGQANDAVLDEQLFRPQGTLIGYDALDGDLPGGREHACFITFKFRTTRSSWGCADEIGEAFFRP